MKRYCINLDNVQFQNQDKGNYTDFDMSAFACSKSKQYAGEMGKTVDQNTVIVHNAYIGKNSTPESTTIPKTDEELLNKYADFYNQLQGLYRTPEFQMDIWNELLLSIRNISDASEPLYDQKIESETIKETIKTLNKSTTKYTLIFDASNLNSLSQKIKIKSFGSGVVRLWLSSSKFRNLFKKTDVRNEKYDIHSIEDFFIKDESYAAQPFKDEDAIVLEKLLGVRTYKFFIPYIVDVLLEFKKFFEKYFADTPKAKELFKEYIADTLLEDKELFKRYLADNSKAMEQYKQYIADILLEEKKFFRQHIVDVFMGEQLFKRYLEDTPEAMELFKQYVADTLREDEKFFDRYVANTLFEEAFFRDYIESNTSAKDLFKQYISETLQEEKNFEKCLAETFLPEKFFEQHIADNAQAKELFGKYVDTSFKTGGLSELENLLRSLLRYDGEYTRSWIIQMINRKLCYDNQKNSRCDKIKDLTSVLDYYCSVYKKVYEETIKAALAFYSSNYTLESATKIIKENRTKHRECRNCSKISNKNEERRYKKLLNEMNQIKSLDGKLKCLYQFVDIMNLQFNLEPFFFEGDTTVQQSKPPFMSYEKADHSRTYLGFDGNNGVFRELWKIVITENCKKYEID